MSEDRAQREAVTWRLRLPTMTDADWVDLTEWLEADPANARAYDAVALLEAELPRILVSDGVRRTSAAPTIEPVDEIPDRPARRGIAFALAAALVATISVGVGYRLMPTTAPDQEIVTAPGQSRAIRLHDGTIVALNGGSRLVVAAGTDREVRLDRGQASFRVVHDAAAPFRVRVGATVLQDVGTQFDVTRYPDALEIAVAEGAVAYDPTGSNVVLHAGQAARVAGSPLTLEVREVDRRAVGGWRSHRLIYHAATLDRIAVDVGRDVGKDVTVDPKLAGTTFSGVLLVNGGESQVRSRIEGVLGIDVIADGKGWHFRPSTHAPH
jgi:transmembrane sensor